MAVTWDNVMFYMEQDGRCCNPDDCPYAKAESQRLPYGSTYATESWIECTLGDAVTDKPEDCPGCAGLEEEEEE